MKNKKRKMVCMVCVLVMLITAFGLSGCGKDTALDPDNPVTVTVWNYYNGDQLTAFEKLIKEFNDSVGKEKGIVVVNVGQSDINTLADSLIESAEGKAGAQEKPVLAAVYAETAFILDEKDALEPLDEYFSDDELSEYVEGFIDEGRFNEDNELLLFPILKSTELFTANETDWKPFAKATGVNLKDIKTKEDLTDAAKKYYEWTDSLTPGTSNDGKALYGRDSVANYVYIGAYQLGHELFKVEDGELNVDMDRDTFKALWDNYYIPYINGYFGAYAKFRSEDCKTGKILALTSSTSSVGYLPTAVTTEDDSTHDISTYASKDLAFAKSVNKGVVQQGASYCMLKSSEAQQEGAVEFLKWSTEPERNLEFALMSGYSPVTMEANKEKAITEAYDGDTSDAKDKIVLQALLISADSFSNDVTYATKPFAGSKDARMILGDALENTAKADREAVLKAMNSGTSREAAIAKYVSDEYFNQWFDSLCSQIDEAISK